MVKDLGLTPIQALQAATRNVGEFFDASDLFGTVRTSRIADLVILAELDGLIPTAERAARQ